MTDEVSHCFQHPEDILDIWSLYNRVILNISAHLIFIPDDVNRTLKVAFMRRGEWDIKG